MSSREGQGLRDQGAGVSGGREREQEPVSRLGGREEQTQALRKAAGLKVSLVGT